MSNTNSTQDHDRTINFASGPFYTLHADVTPNDVRDQLSMRLTHLCAMLTMTSGAGFEAFSTWNDEIRENYLWACSMLADECKALSEINISD